MKKTSLFRLLVLSALCFAMGHAAYSQPSLGNAPVAKAASKDADDTPPVYMLVLAGISAVAFIGTRRRAKI